MPPVIYVIESVFSLQDFENWGFRVQTRPSLTLILPTTVKDEVLQNFVLGLLNI